MIVRANDNRIDSHWSSEILGEANAGRYSKILLMLVIISAFGPYLYKGLTTAQIVVYPVCLFALVIVVGQRAKIYTEMGVVIGAAVVTAIIATVAMLTPGLNTSPWGRGNSLANADNLLMPMCTLIAVAVLGTSWTEVERPLHIVTSTLSITMFANAAVAGLQFISRAPLLIQDRFWGAGDTGGRSLTVGRFIGIFSQPSMAGLAYSFGCLSVIYALRNRPILQPLMLAALIFAGALSASKVFLLIGLPVSLFFFVYVSRRRFALLLVVVILLSPILGSRVAQWKGLTRLAALLPGSPDWLTTVTGNRYGAESSTQPVISAILRDNPWAGYGLGGLDRATDTTYVFVLSLAGLFGVVAVIVQVVALVVGYWNRRKVLPSRERVFFGASVLVIVASTFGSNALHGNRASVMVWAIVGLLLVQEVRPSLPTRGNGIDLRDPGSAGRQSRPGSATSRHP